MRTLRDRQLKKFAATLLFLREDLEMTQRELEKISGLKHSWVSQFENCRRAPSFHSLVRLKKGLGCSYNDLMYGL